MKVKKQTYSSILLLLVFYQVCFFISCNSTEKSIDDKSDIIVYSIPEEYSKELLCRDFFSKLEIIPLETSEKSLIRRIDHLILDDTCIYIQNGMDNVLKFSKRGNFISKIGNKGVGPEEYTYLFDLQISKDYILILSQNSIFKYDKNGKFIKKIKLETNRKMPSSPTRFCFFSDDNYYLWNSSFDGYKSDSSFYALHHIVDGKSDKSYLKSEFTGVTNHKFYKIDDNKYHIRPGQYDNSVYELNSDSLQAIYTIDFGENNVQINELTKGYSYEISEKNDKLIEKRAWSRVHYYFCESNSLLAFSFIKYDSENGLAWAVVNKKNKKVLVCEKIVIDNILPIYPISANYLSDELIAIAYPDQIIDYIDKANISVSSHSLITQEQIDMLKKLTAEDNVILVKISSQIVDASKSE